MIMKADILCDRRWRNVGILEVTFPEDIMFLSFDVFLSFVMIKDLLCGIHNLFK